MNKEQLIGMMRSIARKQIASRYYLWFEKIKKEPERERTAKNQRLNEEINEQVENLSPLMNEFADTIIAHYDNRWVRVDTEKPLHRMLIWIWCPKTFAYPTVGYYDAVIQTFKSDHNIKFDGNKHEVTHWQVYSTPTPPNSDKNGKGSEG